MNNKILIHFDSSDIEVYALENDDLKLLNSERILFEDGFDRENGLSENKLQELGEFLKALTEYTDTVDNEFVKLYATGLFQHLTPLAKERLINYVYINHGLYFNVVSDELEAFYRSKSTSSYSPKLINGVINQEFRSVVICGSFRKHINHISELGYALDSTITTYRI